MQVSPYFTKNTLKNQDKTLFWCAIDNNSPFLITCPQTNSHASSIIKNRQQRPSSTTRETSPFPTHTTGLLKLSANLVYFCLNICNKSSAASDLFLILRVQTFWRHLGKLLPVHEMNLSSCNRSWSSCLPTILAVYCPEGKNAIFIIKDEVCSLNR